MNRHRTIKLAALCTAFAIVGTAGVASAGAPDKKDKAKVLVNDDFSDDSNGWTPGGEPGVYSVALEDGTIVFRNEKNEYPPFHFPDSLLPVGDTLRSQRVEVDASIDEGTAIPAAVCLYNSDIEAPDYSAYYFGFRPVTGEAAISQISPEGKNDRLAKTSKPVLEPGTKKVRISGDCIQKEEAVQLVMRVNGKRVVTFLDTEDPITRTGVPALTVYGTDAESFPVQVSYDNFKASQLK